MISGCEKDLWLHTNNQPLNRIKSLELITPTLNAFVLIVKSNNTFNLGCFNLQMSKV